MYTHNESRTHAHRHETHRQTQKNIGRQRHRQTGRTNYACMHILITNSTCTQNARTQIAGLKYTRTSEARLQSRIMQDAHKSIMHARITRIMYDTRQACTHARKNHTSVVHLSIYLTDWFLTSAVAQQHIESHPYPLSHPKSLPPRQ